MLKAVQQGNVSLPLAAAKIKTSRLLPAGVLEARRLPVTVHGHQVALLKVPLVGWLQIVAVDGLIKDTGFTFAQRKSISRMTATLNALLVGGGLVMMAIIRIFFQVGFTGSAAESAKNGSREEVLWRRAARSKHGRFSL